MERLPLAPPDRLPPVSYRCADELRAVPTARRNTWIGPSATGSIAQARERQDARSRGNPYPAPERAADRLQPGGGQKRRRRHP